MPTKVAVNVNEPTDDSSAKPGKKKVQRGRVTTRSQDRPKSNASRPDKHDDSPLLVGCASAKTSKTDASLPPVPLCPTKKLKPCRPGEKKRKAPDEDLVHASDAGLKAAAVAEEGQQIAQSGGRAHHCRFSCGSGSGRGTGNCYH
jgi:hypothetical protein